MNKNSKVLALKYRPQNFFELIGQEVIAETIINSIKANKVPNAYLFTGIRGVGKTTIARIVAKSLNCTNGIDKICKDDLCDNCEAITNSSHIDVLEMDAASKTGVDDVRDLIEFSRYGPSTSKYKIFIIDEVHMLSKQAFNALLKTLEEPPQYETGGGLKFIFATTEIKKIPITILSRCQRFDLRRFDNDMIRSLINKVCEKEMVSIDDQIINLIARASGGSARDSLSLLDQAMALSTDGNISEEKIRQMLGMSDQSRVIDLYEYISTTEIEKALLEVRDQIDIGTDPVNLIESLGDLIHELTRLKVTNSEDDNLSLGPDGFKRIKTLKEKVSVKHLSRYWQMILKASSEIKNFSKPLSALEMAIIRMSYISDLPTPDEIIKKIEEDNLSLTEKKTPNSEITQPSKSISTTSVKQIQQEKVEEETNDVNPQSFEDIIELAKLKKNIRLQYDLENNVSLVSFEKGKIELSVLDNNEKILSTLSNKLYEWTSKKWIVINSSSQGQKTIKEKRDDSELELQSLIKEHPIYKKAEMEFDKVEIISIEEVPKLSIVSNENNDKVKDK